MTSPKLQQSLDGGIHSMLNKLAGNWQGTMKTYFDGINPVNEAEVTGIIKPLFDGRFVLHEYRSSFEQKPFEGIAIYGYNMKDLQYESAWIDTFHMGTGIMFSSGIHDSHFDATGSYTASGPGSEVWQWRTEIIMEDEDTLNIIAYNIDTRDNEFKAVEMLYKRVV